MKSQFDQMMDGLKDVDCWEARGIQSARAPES